MVVPCVSSKTARGGEGQDPRAANFRAACYTTRPSWPMAKAPAPCIRPLQNVGPRLQPPPPSTLATLLLVLPRRTKKRPYLSRQPLPPPGEDYPTQGRVLLFSVSSTAVDRGGGTVTRRWGAALAGSRDMASAVTRWGPGLERRGIIGVL